jgi:glycine cleavage system protein P-like pyridoxal-binding family
MKNVVLKGDFPIKQPSSDVTLSIKLNPRVFELLKKWKWWTDAHSDASMEAWNDYQSILNELHELLKDLEPEINN